MIFDYEAEMNRVSSVQAFEMKARGGTSGPYVWGMNAKWKHVRTVLDPTWRCPYCGFLSFGYSDIEQLQKGVRAGRHCCNIVLEAVRAWHRHGTGSLDGVHIFAWELGYADTSEESVGCSILLRWPHEEGGKDIWTPSYDTTINIFKSGPVIDAIDFVSGVPFIERSRPSGDSSSEQAIRSIKRWISNCSNQHHRYCSVKTKSQLPKRVLELTEGSFHLRENLNNEEMYACLSHCWGSTGPSFTLTKDTFELLKAGMSSAELPRTFREAIELCLRLGIRYLWIDALCIIQQDKDDWKEAAATMASIYENAFVTIAATRSSDSEGGCFSRLQGFSQATRLESSGLYACKRRPDDFPRASYSLLSEKGLWPLLCRAWVFQERLLSTRVIHFTDYQVVWECQSMQESETGDVSDKWMKDDWKLNSRSSSSGPVEYPFKFPHKDSNLAWQRAVAQYSHLQLTYVSDRLPAIAAIVQRTMRIRKDDTYIAGMWRSSLLHDSAWHRIEHGENLKRPDNTAPTWSWASVPGAVGFYEVSLLPSTELLNVQYTAIGPAHVGEVCNARVSLRGLTLTAALQHAGITHRGSERDTILYNLKPSLPTGYGHLKPILWRFIPDFGLSLGERPVNLDNSFSILFLWHNSKEHRWFGLVLRQISDTDYERIGIADLSYFDSPIERFPGSSCKRPRLETCADMINNLPVKEFKIV
ncbi:HET-domain-containing protein [Macroventuria anomochaeta]|uniref:HET-domain-containing protein n=1 Tax=Macroventuria anomochaeta TaxID=301207 RepID=A0ACB6RHI4_9PLEO|nr:HET-domain-containing protein [Macroventuria anomochaeta]KAF2621208.1 HET-domain-containing protein [Macroventuria anomochaeta]